MMKNNYQAPVLENEKLEVTDVITASGEGIYVGDIPVESTAI